MEVPPAHQPDFVSQQLDVDRDPVFRAQLVEIGERFALQKKRIIFISRAWPYDDDRLQVNEGWSVECVDRLYDHLQLLGFHVILDKRDLGVGVQLDGAMKASVDKADHVLLMITNTYIHKATKDFTSGVAREIHYVTHKVKAMDPKEINGWVIAGERRFVLPLAFTNDTRGFPLADSHPGIATIFVPSVGYRQALIDLAEKVYDVEPTLLRDVVPSYANILIHAIKKCYSERKYISRPFHAEPILIKEGYVRVAIVKEAEQLEKMKEQFSEKHGQQETEKSDDTPALFEDKRLTSFEQMYEAKESIDIGDIFKPDKEIKNKGKIPKRLLVLGRAGIGKSTLCQKMAHQWANSEVEAKLWEENGQEKFKLIIWVPLRNLLDYPVDATICDVVLRECISNGHIGEKIISRDAILRGLKELKPEDILYVCDGYDEVEGRTTPFIEELLAQENVILTSRPHGIDQYLTAYNAIPFDRKFENIGFLDEDIEKYIRTFFGDQEENKGYIESLILFLESHPNIWGVAHIPINLMLICVTWKEKAGQFDLKKNQYITMTDLYYGLLANLGRRYLDKRGTRELKKFSFRKILNHEKCRPILAVLSELAFEQMSTDSLLISGKKISEDRLLDRYLENPTLRDDVIHFGVLAPTRTETYSDKTEFYFVHLTFQEFFAAFYIAEKLRVNDEEIKCYISSNKYYRRHEMVWWFVAGLLKEEIETLELFFNLLEAEPRDLGQLYHQLLLMRCMDECQLKVKPQRKKTYLSNFCHLLDVGLSSGQFFYDVILRYLNLSEAVFSQSEIIDKFWDLLNRNYVDGDDSIEDMKCRVVGILMRQFNVPTKIIDRVFMDPKERVRACAVDFFKGRKEVPEEIQGCIAALLADPDYRVKNSAIYFFGCRKEVSEEIQLRISDFLECSNCTVRASAVKFFGRQKEVPNLIQERLANLICDPDEWVRKGVIKFFGDRKIILTVSIDVIVFKLKDSHDEKIRAWLIEFFGGQEEVPEEIQRCIAALITEPASRRIQIAAIEFFSTRKKVPEEIQRCITELFVYQDGYIAKYAVDFFSGREKVPEEIQRCIAALIKEPASKYGGAVAAAINFFSGRNKEVPEEIQGCIAALIKESASKYGEAVVAAAINFFSGRKEVPEEIQGCIAALINESASKYDDAVVAAINFFSGRKEVPEEIQRCITALFTESPYELLQVAAINFFSSRKEVSEEIQRELIALFFTLRKRHSPRIFWAVHNFFVRCKEIIPGAFDTVGKFFREPFLEGGDPGSGGSLAVDFLRALSVNQVVKSFEKLDKSKINRDFLTVMIMKLLISNFPIFSCDRACVQVGSGAVIHFESEQALADFIERFQQEMGFNFEIAATEFSPAKAMSKLGQFTDAQQFLGENALEELEDEEELRWCRIL